MQMFSSPSNYCYPPGIVTESSQNHCTVQENQLLWNGGENSLGNSWFHEHVSIASLLLLWSEFFVQKQDCVGYVRVNKALYKSTLMVTLIEVLHTEKQICIWSIYSNKNKTLLILWQKLSIIINLSPTSWQHALRNGVIPGTQCLPLLKANEHLTRSALMSGNSSCWAQAYPPPFPAWWVHY